MARIVIKGGMVAGFADEVKLPLQEAHQRRVSVIVPRRRLFRAAFVLIRMLVPESGAVAGWTRTWACDWMVRIGSKTYGPFQDRLKAIQFEKDTIQAAGMVDEYLAEGQASSDARSTSSASGSLAAGCPAAPAGQWPATASEKALSQPDRPVATR